MQDNFEESRGKIQIQTMILQVHNTQCIRIKHSKMLVSSHKKMHCCHYNSLSFSFFGEIIENHVNA